MLNLLGVSMACVLVAVVHTMPSGREPFRLRFDPYEVTWEQFKRDFGRSYYGAEETHRRSVFVENVKEMERHNWQYFNQQTSFYLGINQFADMTLGEYRQYNKLRGPRDPPPPSINCSTFSPPLNGQVPDTVDWRTKGYVTPVKNQRMCGSCWAFSTTGSLEGQHFRKTGKLASLSEQQLVDCAKAFGNEGCEGGLMELAYHYIFYVHGLETEADYPYTGYDNPCVFNQSEIAADLSACKNVPESEEALKAAVGSQGPVSVAIDANHRSFQFYEGGVYNEPACNSTMLDHGVLAVGYGNLNGKDYWLVKNSWADTWGVKGYIMMSRNKDNQCGIASLASFPLV